METQEFERQIFAFYYPVKLRITERIIYIKGCGYSRYKIHYLSNYKCIPTYFYRDLIRLQRQDLFPYSRLTTTIVLN